MNAYLGNETFKSTLDDSIEAHVMAFLAEESRINHGIPQDVYDKMK
ncbi:MAG TPA: hypothetical protein P5173_01960 [Bacilli bacterium]|nr:hypothetical protein [Bacilli bacterium]